MANGDDVIINLRRADLAKKENGDASGANLQELRAEKSGSGKTSC
jgi:hypothetical protein